MSELSKLPRITSIDAYRGLVMFLMVAAGMALYNIPKHEHFEDVMSAQPHWVRTLWETIAFHTNHVKWGGCSLHDMIQPSFSFLVGVALPFSLASRQAKGQSFGLMLAHSIFRSLLLIALGVFLRSTHAGQTNFTFEDTLSQIGLGYTFLFLLGFLRPAWQWAAIGVLLVGYWALFAFWPLPPADFDPFTVGIKPDWDKNYDGFFAHWNINTNPAAAFDRWFLNLFGRDKDQLFLGNGGGYATLSFIPTLATMILGLIAGNWMKEGLSRQALWLRLFLAGVLLTAAGLGAEAAGICPIVKPIWTPAWTLFSGGICFLFVLVFTVLFDNGSFLRVLAFPLVVIGANSIFIYCAYHLTNGWLKDTLKIHLNLPEKTWGFKTYEVFGPMYANAVRGAIVIAIYWLVLLWMYRKRIFVKI
jgi:predicted acyltransferase